MTKPRRTAPRKQRRVATAAQAVSNRARRLEAIEQQGRASRRVLFPQPEDEERYRP